MCAAKWSLSPFLKQCVVTAGVSLNNLAFGGALGYPAVMLPRLRAAGMGLTSDQESWIASINMISLFAGSALTVPAMRRGRRLTNYVISLAHVLSWLIIVLADSYEVLMIGRFLNGASQGLFMTVFGAILGEYTSPVHRGSFLAAVSFAQATGVLLVHLIGSLLSWRDTALLFGCFSVVSFAIAVFTPESPSWFAMEGRYEDCRKAFRWLRGPEEVEELDRMIQARMYYDSSNNQSNIRETLRAFCKRELYIPLIIGSLMFGIICSSGSIILASYMDVVLGALIGADCNLAVWMCLLDGVRLASCGASLYAAKRLPRRVLLFWSGGACVLTYVAEAAYIFTKAAGLIDVHWLPASLIIVHVAMIGLGMVTVPYMISAEIFPLQYRGTCSCLCSVPLGVFAFGLTKTFAGVVTMAGVGGAWLAHGSLAALALAAAWPLLPETRGRTLQDIEEHFRRISLVPDDPEAKESLNLMCTLKKP